MPSTDLPSLVAAHEHELVALRRVLHSQPELSGAEHVTTEMLVERLIVEGLEPRVLSGGTGLVCDIPLDPGANAESRTTAGSAATAMPVVAIRADIDALAMDDETTTPYRSQHPGVAHACGHDVHTAAALGAVLALLDVRRHSPRLGVVRVIFEPSEEALPGGAVDVIAEGWLDGVSSIFGVHCDPKLEAGNVGLRVGALTSAADSFEVTLRGPGGHTARPELTIDLVRWAGRVADRLADTVRGMTTAEVALVFGALRAGAAPNVIPATASLRGSFRTPARDAWLGGHALVEAAVAEVLSERSLGATPTWHVDYTRGVPPVINDPVTTGIVASVASELFGPDSIADTPQSMGADSFAWYLERIPGTYVRLGTHDPFDDGPRLDLHSATFDVDERAIAVGSQLLAGVALAALAQAGG